MHVENLQQTRSITPGMLNSFRYRTAQYFTMDTVSKANRQQARAGCAKFLYNWRMIELNIPGRGSLQLEHLVTDVNGTLAVDGQLFEGLARILKLLSDRLEIHMLTADTHGQQHLIDHILGLQAVRIQPGDEAAQKAEFVRKLNADWVVAIGQGANDAAMLKTAALGICVMSVEGTAVETLLSADLVAPDIFSALALLEKPLRIVASLRK